MSLDQPEARWAPVLKPPLLRVENWIPSPTRDSYLVTFSNGKIFDFPAHEVFGLHLAPDLDLSIAFLVLYRRRIYEDFATAEAVAQADQLSEERRSAVGVRTFAVERRRRGVRVDPE